MDLDGAGVVVVRLCLSLLLEDLILIVEEKGIGFEAAGFLLNRKLGFGVFDNFQG